MEEDACTQSKLNCQAVTGVKESLEKLEETSTANHLENKGLIKENTKKLEKTHLWVIASTVISGASAVSFPEEAIKLLSYVYKIIT